MGAGQPRAPLMRTGSPHRNESRPPTSDLVTAVNHAAPKSSRSAASYNFAGGHAGVKACTHLRQVSWWPKTLSVLPFPEPLFPAFSGLFFETKVGIYAPSFRCLFVDRCCGESS